MAAWTPSNLSAGKLAHWYDINDSSSLTDVGAGVISVINDKSGNARHLSQGTSGKRGTRTATNVNFYNQPTLAIPLSGGYPGTIAHAIPDNSNFLMDGGALNQGISGGTSAAIGTPVNAIVAVWWQPGSSHGGAGQDGTDFYWKNGVALSAAAEPGTGVLTTGGMQVFCGRIKSSGQSTSVGRFTSAESTNGAFLNRSTDYGRTADVDMAEILVLTGTTTTADRQNIEGYLSWKWAGDGSLLPVGHPYKSAAPTTGGGTDVIPAATNLRPSAWTPPTPGPITQKHVLTATAVRTTAWTKPTPALFQKHVLTGSLRTASPVFPGSLTLGAQLIATSLRVSALTMPTPALTQKHVLATAGLRTSALTLTAGVIQQKHVLTAAGKRVSSPVIGPAFLNGAVATISSYIKRWIGMKVGQGSG